MQTLSSPKHEFVSGVRDTVPLLLGALPFGIIYGALASTSGLPAWTAVGMSIFVFAGSSQFVAVSLVTQNVPLALIVLTTFVVNLRHALYSLSLGPYLKNLSQRWLVPLGFWLTDETYAVTIQRFTKPDASPYKHWYMFGSALAMYLNWQTWTIFGVIIGQRIENAASWGFDFAMVVTFIGIAVPMIRSSPMLVCALAASASALLLEGVPNKMGLILAAGIGITAGIAAERWSPPTPSHASPIPEPEELS